MNKSSNATTHLPPPLVLWAQRRDRIFLTLQLDDCKDPKIEVKDDSVYFRGKGGTGQTEHEVLIELFKPINKETSQHRVTAREISFVLLKTDDSQGFWPRLLKDSKKVHYLKTDFNKWKDSDDDESDEDNQEDFNLDQMMQSMGGLQGAGDGGALPDEGDDSDDEDLPDLQQ